MAERSAGSIRARVRAEMTEEIKAVARRHLAAEGADLSLRAVARDMGMVSSALYRYFPSRAELLGSVSLELFGHLTNVFEERTAWFEHQVCTMTRFIGLAGQNGP